MLLTSHVKGVFVWLHCIIMIPKASLELGLSCALALTTSLILF